MIRGKKLDVFVVDDDPMHNQMLKDQLEGLNNVRVHSFSTGEECIEAVYNKKPEVVFLDYNLNNVNKNALNGLEILERIKDDSPETEVVMFSGQDDIEVAVQTLKYGAFDYIVKSPSAFPRSENVVFKVLSRKKLQDENSRYKKLAAVFAIGFVVILIIFIVMHYEGLIPDRPGWI
jgi:two-component system, OmpR family, response regulator